MKKLFISQPMNGREEIEILNERDAAIVTAEEQIGEPVELVDSYFKDFKPNNPLEYLGRSILCLAQADVAYFCKGWQDARGCQIEHECAVQYGIDRIELIS